MSDGPPSLDRERVTAYRRRVENRSGLRLEQLICMALEAEQSGASPSQVRAILDGELGAFLGSQGEASDQPSPRLIAKQPGLHDVNPSRRSSPAETNG
jgi:hypothetical protein